MKKIIIIGANNFQLPLIKKASEMGIETHVFAWEEGAVGKDFAHFFYPISITNKEAILEKAKLINPNGIVSIGSDLAMLTVNYVANELGLVGNSLECTNVSTNKFLMRERLNQNGLPCPRFTNCNHVDGIQALDFRYPIIVKPTDRSGSRGVTKVNASNELGNAIKRAITESFGKEIIIEEFIEGQEYSVEMISWQGNHHFLQITEKETSGAPYFVEKGQHQPASISNDIKQRIISIIKKSLSTLGVEYGASHSEIIITKSNDIFITEIGARMGGDYIGSDLVELSTGFDFVKAVINVSMGIFEEVSTSESNFSGVYYCFPRPGEIIEIKDNSCNFPEVVRSEIYLKVGDFVPEIRESNHRPACYIYKSVDKRFVPKEALIEIVTI
jgi:biotin carboxylase